MKIFFWITWAVFIFSSGVSAIGACPETLLKNYRSPIRSKAQAEKIFKDFFSEKNGFPVFDSAKIKIDDSPSCSGNYKKKETCYFYDNWYGMGPNGLGGYLYPDGRLVKRGYCK